MVNHITCDRIHVPGRYDFMVPHRRGNARLRARGVRGALPPGRGVWGGLRPPQGSKGGLGGGTPPNFKTDNLNFVSPEGMSDLPLFVTMFN